MTVVIISGVVYYYRVMDNILFLKASVKGIIMCSLYHVLLLLVSLPVVCHLEKNGVSRGWPFAMGLNGLSHTGHILNS